MQLYSFNPETFSHVSKNLSALRLTSSPHSEQQSAVPMEILAFHAFQKSTEHKRAFLQFASCHTPHLVIEHFLYPPWEKQDTQNREDWELV